MNIVKTQILFLCLQAAFDTLAKNPIIAFTLGIKPLRRYVSIACLNLFKKILIKCVKQLLIKETKGKSVVI